MVIIMALINLRSLSLALASPLPEDGATALQDLHPLHARLARLAPREPLVVLGMPTLTGAPGLAMVPAAVRVDENGVVNVAAADVTNATDTMAPKKRAEANNQAVMAKLRLMAKK